MHFSIYVYLYFNMDFKVQCSIWCTIAWEESYSDSLIHRLYLHLFRQLSLRPSPKKSVYWSHFITGYSALNNFWGKLMLWSPFRPSLPFWLISHVCALPEAVLLKVNVRCWGCLWVSALPCIRPQGPHPLWHGRSYFLSWSKAACIHF